MVLDGVATLGCCRRNVATLLFALAAAAQAQAQETGPPARLRIFLDCRSDCDFDFIRTEMEFVDYVRDRADADVHVLVTAQNTGPGGREYTINYIGLRFFAAVNDTLRWVAPQDYTDEVRRQGFLRVLRVGMMRFIAATPLAALMNIEVVEEEDRPGGGTTAGVRDPWNFWVFRIGVDGSINGESQQESRDASLEFSANRTTEAWRLDFGVDASYDDEKFEIDEDEDSTTRTVVSVRRSYEFSFTAVKSLGAHLSGGVTGSVESSTFGNQKVAWKLAPSVEYNIFPYSESTRRAFTLRYAAGIRAFDWREVTIYGEERETRPAHAFSASYTTRETWGDMNLSTDLTQYLHDTAKYRLELSGNVEVRVFRGFSLNADVTYARVRDQLSIPARGATEEEILLRRRQLQTSYEFNLEFGITYRFGSIFNSVVNPRFRRDFGFN
jgi:hypothetical protein